MDPTLERGRRRGRGGGGESGGEREVEEERGRRGEEEMSLSHSSPTNLAGLVIEPPQSETGDDTGAVPARRLGTVSPLCKCTILRTSIKHYIIGWFDM